MKRKWIIVAAVFVVVAGLFLLARRNSVLSKDAASIQTIKISRKDFIKTVASSGKTKAAKSVELKFQTSGRLAWVGVKEGDHVKAYQAIAGMDAREVQKNLEKSLRDYSAQRSDFEETWRTTWGPATQSHETLDHAFSDTARIILEKNQWDLDKAVLDVELKHLSLEYATLVTPIAGIVTHIDTPVPGVNITPATSVFEIVDPGSISFEAKIDEVDIGLLSLGQEAKISLDAYPDREFVATISSIAYAAETSTGGATVFPVELSLADSENLRVGFNGDVTIEAIKLPRALSVPVSAVREEGKTKYIYKKVGSSYEKTPVTVGPSSDNETVVTMGINEGDEVVTKGFAQIPTKKS
jgi:HlyD family secretion protein